MSKLCDRTVHPGEPLGKPANEIGQTPSAVPRMGADYAARLIAFDLGGLIVQLGGANHLPPSDVLAERWQVSTSTAQQWRDYAMRGVR